MLAEVHPNHTPHLPGEEDSFLTPTFSSSRLWPSALSPHPLAIVLLFPTLITRHLHFHQPYSWHTEVLQGAPTNHSCQKVASMKAMDAASRAAIHHHTFDRWHGHRHAIAGASAAAAHGAFEGQSDTGGKRGHAQMGGHSLFFFTFSFLFLFFFSFSFSRAQMMN